jgi:hypothetical protein
MEWIEDFRIQLEKQKKSEAVATVSVQISRIEHWDSGVFI